MIPFSGRYTREQWRKGLRLAMYPTGVGLVLRVLVSALILADVGALIASLLQGETSGLRLLRSGVSAAILAFWVCMPYLRASREETRSWRASAGHLSLAGVVTSEGILSNASAGGDIEKWDAFVRVHMRDDMVVLVGEDGLATILPRDFFATEDDWQTFRQLVTLNVVEPK